MPIRINRITQKKPDYSFTRPKVIQGNDVDEFYDRHNLSIEINSFEASTQCPWCKSRGSVVNYKAENGEKFHFRCTVPECGYKF